MCDLGIRLIMRYVGLHHKISRNLLCVNKAIPLIHIYKQGAYAQIWNDMESWIKMVLSDMFGVYLFILSFLSYLLMTFL